MAEPRRLRLSQKWAYAVGHAQNDLTASTWFGLVLLVFTQVDRLSKHDAGLLMLIGQVADAIATPVVGYCSDRTRSAWGSRMPWHLAGCVGVALSFPVLLSACWPALRMEASDAHWAHHPALLRAVELLYYAGAVVVFQLGWAATQVAHMAIVPELTPDFSERTELNSMRYAMTVLSNLLVYGIAWAMLLGHTGPLRPRDSGIFTRLSLILTLIGVLFSAWFHLGLLEVFRASGARGDSSHHSRRGALSRPASRAGGGSSPDEAPAMPPDSWDSLEGGGGYFPLPPPPDASGGGADSWDSFEGFLLAAHNLPPPPTQPAAAAAPAEAATPDGLSAWLRKAELWDVAALYMCTRLLLNVSQIYLPLYLVATLSLPTACIANVPLALYMASMAATPVLRAANRVFGRRPVAAASLLMALGSACAWGMLHHNSHRKFELVVLNAAALGWSSSCAMVTTLSMAADVIGDRTSSGALVYGLLSLTDKLSSGVAIMLVQAWDPCVSRRRPGGDDDGACAAAAAYYRHVMVWVPGAAAAAALTVLLAGAVARGAQAWAAKRAAAEAAALPSADVEAEGTVRGGVRGSRLADRLAAAATSGDAAAPLLADSGAGGGSGTDLQAPSTPPGDASPIAADASPLASAAGSSGGRRGGLLRAASRAGSSPSPSPQRRGSPESGSNFDPVIFHI